MLRFIADDNFNYYLIKELQSRQPELDIVCLKDLGLSGIDDDQILQLASQEGRVLLTHDVTTITQFANERITQELPTPGIFVLSIEGISDRMIADILLLAESSNYEEWQGQIRYLPLS